MSNTLKTQVMKRLLTIGLMLASAFALTNCTEQIASPVQEEAINIDETNDTLLEEEVGTPYEVFVESYETKTAMTNDWKTAWLDSSQDGGPDMINLFSIPYNGSEYIKHGAFEFVGNQTFHGELYGGGISNLADKNNWYSVYPYNSNSSSGTTGITANVIIGASKEENYIQTQNAADNKTHLAGPNYPMYGIKNNVPKDKTPKFKMSHLFSIVGLKIQNKTAGPIVVSDVEFLAPEEIIGNFNVNITGDEPTFSKVSADVVSKTARVELPSPYSVAAGSSVTLYLAVKPFDASNKVITIAINGTASKGNGVSRTVTMPANIDFKAGKITTVTVPVEELSFHHEKVNPASSNVLNVKSTGMVQEGKYVKRWVTTTANTVTMGNSTSETMVINGKNVSAYVIGSDNAVGTVTIKGKAKELIPYVPIEFYASSWNGEKAVMRVEKITAWYYFLLAYVELPFDYAKLTQYMAASRITFSGLVPLEQAIYNGKKHLTILDEEPYHKRVSKEQIEALMQNCDDDKTDDANGFKPTYDGLYAAITNPSSLPNDKSTPLSQMKSEADITAKIIFDKIFEKLGDGSLGDLAGIIFTSPKAMFETVADMPIQVTLSTVAKNGSEGATDNRIVIWGLNSPNVK